MKYSELRFICVCVESQRVAKMFDSIFQFQHCWNAYIPGREYMPRGYGQLGCSGFIIADQKGNFISRRTKRFLDYGQEAFRDVETILQYELDALQLAQKSAKGEAVVATIMEGRDGKEVSIVPSTKRAKLSEPEEEKKEISLEERLNSFLNDHATGIDMVDHEHGECITALQHLLKRLAVDELETAVFILKAHFESEEHMMKQHGFGGDVKSSFSAIRSHIADHQKIIKIGMVELQRIKALRGSCTTGE